VAVHGCLLLAGLAWHSLESDLKSLTQRERSFDKQLGYGRNQNGSIGGCSPSQSLCFCSCLRLSVACREGIAQLESDLASLTQQESSLRKQLEQKETRLQTVEANIQELKQSVQEHQAELRTELHNHLSAVERQELADLTPRLKQLQVSLAAIQYCDSCHHHHSHRMATSAASCFPATTALIRSAMPRADAEGP